MKKMIGTNLRIEYNPSQSLMCVPDLKLAKEAIKMNFSQRDLCVQFYTFLENYLDSIETKRYIDSGGRMTELKKVQVSLYDYLQTQDVIL